MPDFDITIVGAGHNALVCAGYLAKAGYSVGVFERRSVVGGAVVTEEHIPGYKFDLGGSAHILINHTTIVADLELEKYGLEYIDLDPLFFHPFPDGNHITIWREIHRACESIATVSPEDAENYRRFFHKWKPTAEAVLESFLHAPTPLNLARYLGRRMFKATDDFPDAVTQALRGYGQFVRENFVSDEVRAMVAWMAAQSGPPPTEPLSAPLAMWHPLYHISGMKRPRGGSGMLTQALAKMIEAHGGKIHTDAPVKKIVVKRGHASGIELANGHTASSRIVVSGAHLHTLLRMLPDDAVPANIKRRLRRSRIGNGFGMVVRWAMNELPNYRASPSDDPVKGSPHHRGLQFICPTVGYLERAYGDYVAGRPSREPGLIVMTFSAADDTLAPPDKHVLFTWGQYYPYELATHESWDAIEEREADRMLDVLAAYAPNVRDAVVGRLIESPLYLERELGLLRGNVMHLEMSVDQMFAMRPGLKFSNYRGPVKGLYMTGASTHPGGGIMGAAGQNAAARILADLSFRGRMWSR
jgi:phytoene dehydrogenase-like protein